MLGARSFARLQWQDFCSNNARHSDKRNGIFEEGLESVGSALSLIPLLSHWLINHWSKQNSFRWNSLQHGLIDAGGERSYQSVTVKQ
jgi:hypothetical protein